MFIYLIYLCVSVEGDIFGMDDVISNMHTTKFNPAH